MTLQNSEMELNPHNIKIFSTFLEIVSFLLVTIDLYGEQRLDRLRAAIIDGIGNIRKTRQIDTMSVRIVLVFLLGLFLFVGIHISRKLFGPISILSYSIAGLIVAFIFDILLLALRATEIVVNLLLGTLIAMLVRYKMKDIFLWTGLLLFIVSKVLIVIYTE